MIELALNVPAPRFRLMDQEGNWFDSESVIGKKNLVVYFYPKASTPGCTTQACGVQNYQMNFESLETQVVGISPDKVDKLKKFADKYTLEFPLLSDSDLSVSQAFGVWGMKKFMGREFMGIIRTTFIINKDGNLCHIMQKVNTKTHNEELFAYIKNNL